MALSEPSELYGLALERFVPERGALAKALRASGERERAAEVAAMRKPSLAAWAVNQLVRTQGRAIADLFQAGDQLRQAQSDLLAGRGDGHTLREAADRQRGLVDQLTGVAQGLLSSEGHELSTAMLERVRDTLSAAAIDPDARERVADGCLQRELHHAGIGVSGLAGAPSEDKQAERERERERMLNVAQQAVDEAHRAVERAERELTAAEERRRRAAEALEQAEARLGEARERLEQARRARDRARQALAKASR